MDLGVVNDTIRRSKMRALPRSEVPGARIQERFGLSGVPARGGCRVGEWNRVGGGRGLGSDAIWNRSNDRAGNRGGAWAGKARWVSNRVRCLGQLPRGFRIVTANAAAISEAASSVSRPPVAWSTTRRGAASRKRLVASLMPCSS